MESRSKIVIVDTDCGIDDFFALRFLLESEVEVAAVTVVHGNVSMASSLKQLQLLISAKKIFLGAAQPLSKSDDTIPSWPGHGTDGCGGAYEKVRKILKSENPKENQNHSAVTEILRLGKRHPELTILAIGNKIIFFFFFFFSFFFFFNLFD
jgi:inosine-uridine nucleoside N-ribohydrolase